MATTTRPAPVLTPVSRVAIAAVGAYVGAQVIADVASLKIGIVAGRAVDMGTFIYPITFTLRDVVHKALGTPGGPHARDHRGRRERVHGAVPAVGGPGAERRLVPARRRSSRPCWRPLWRITVASIVAEVVSELVDTEVYHWFVTRVTTRHQWARVAVSNAVSMPARQRDLRGRSPSAPSPGFAGPRPHPPVERGVGHLRGEPDDQGARERGEPAADLPDPRPRLERGRVRRLTDVARRRPRRRRSGVCWNPSPAKAAPSGSMISS